MAEDPIPADVREFIVSHIESISYLEALLLLRANPAVRWTASSVAARLYISEAEAAAILTSLAGSGFAASSTGAFIYGSSPAIDAILARVTELYSRHLIPVTNLIHSRSGAARAFASAFKLRKDT